jgi:hypothetical protein
MKLSRMVVAAVASAFLFGTMAPAPVLAEMAKEETTKKKESKKKELSPQQQKMKSCAADWGREKKEKKVSGKKAHNEFMSKCLKG